MSFGQASAGEGLIRKVATVLQQLILQKPFGSLRDGEQADSRAAHEAVERRSGGHVD